MDNPALIRVTSGLLATMVAIVPVALLVYFWDDLVEYSADAVYSVYVYTVVPLIAGLLGLLAAYLYYLAFRKHRVVRRRWETSRAFKILSLVGLATCIALAVVLVVFFREDVASLVDDDGGTVTGILLVALLVPFAWYFAFGVVRRRKTRKAVAYSITTVAMLVGMTIGMAAFEFIRYVPTDRGPYLSWSDDPRTSMTLSWQSPAPSVRAVEWSTGSTFNTVTTVQASETNLVNLVRRYYYNATITGLSPNTTYWYRIPGFHDEPTPFTTAPDAPVPFSFFAYGDSRESSPVGSEHLALIELMRARHAMVPHSFVINSGDVAQDWDQVRSWDIHYHFIKPVASRMPYFVATGNHEWRGGVPDHEEPHNRMHEVPSGHLNKTSFAFRYSNAYFIVLGYSHAQGEQAATRAWLEDRLQHANTTSGIDWIFLSWHVPPFTGTRGRGEQDAMKNNTCALLHKYGADAVFLGHDHNYQRINITHTSNYTNGMTYLITGGGGAPLYDVAEPNKTWTGTDATGTFGEKFFGQTEFATTVNHYLSVRVDGLVATFTAYKLDGSVLDTFTLVK